MSGPKSAEYTLVGEPLAMMLQRLEQEREIAEACDGFKRLNIQLLSAEKCLKEACQSFRELIEYGKATTEGSQGAEQMLEQIRILCKAISAVDSNCSLKQLHSYNHQIEQMIAAAETVTEAVKKTDYALREKLSREILAQIAQHMNNTTKLPEPTAAVQEIQQPKTQPAEGQHQASERQQRAEQITAELNRLASLPLGAELRLQLEQLRKLSQAIADAKFLKNYYTISVLPFAKKCKQYQQKHDKWMVTNRYYSERLGLEPEAFELSETGLRSLKEHVKALKIMVEKQAEQEYISAAMDEVMAEMGYDVLGRREVQKRNGRRFENKLYHFSPGTAVCVTAAPNGQITMELGGIEVEERAPTLSESQALAEEMEVFCDEFSEFERRLKARGIIPGNRFSMLPPRAEYARMINTAEYEMIQTPELFFRAKRNKPAAAQQMMRKE